MLKRILVLVGARTSPTSPAIARAAALAEAAGASLSLLGVVYDPHLEGYLGRSEAYAELFPSLRDRLVAERQERVDALAAELKGRGLQCEGKAVWANPAHMAAVREAAAADVALVVFAPEEAGSLSTDEWRLVSVSPSPVLVVRSAEAKPYRLVVAAVDPERRNDKPSDLDEKILDLAKRLRELSDARLEVVHCLPSFRSFSFFDSVITGETEEKLKAQRMNELEALVTQAGLPKESGILIEGKPADVLTEKSAQGEGTLLVLGTVQRGPIARLLIGSTAERVLRSAGGDVAVIRPAFLGDEDDEIDADAFREAVNLSAGDEPPREPR